VALSATYSLQKRLLIAVSVLLAVFLGLTGAVLDRAFRASVEAGVAEQLQVQLYVLLAAADEIDGRFYFSENLREPRFGQLNSGLYGYISSDQDGELLRTPSALEIGFSTLVIPHDLERGETRFGRLTSPAGIDFFIIRYTVTWENRQAPIQFAVLETTQTYLVEVSNFRASLWGWLGALALILLVLQLSLLRWGLAPLRRLARDLARMERGESEALAGDYPRELSAVTQNLNLLIASERKQRERYRTTLADLAHSLKTPLAVIQGEMPGLRDESDKNDGRAVLIQEQLDRMNQIVTYQLQRAVRSEAMSALAQQVNIAAVAESLCRAMEKVYADRQVRITRQVDARLNFAGDERDLMEVLGNVLDNACKYGSGQVIIRSEVSPGQPAAVTLSVDDNGPGISVMDAERVLQRGVRLDTLAQGQGIGLAVVADIVRSYGGHINITQSELGGASVRLMFENIRSEH
jgi:two-component system sensor histidine kinase PhoQ